MAKLSSLDKIKNAIREKVALENVLGQSNGDTKALFNAMSIVPEAAMWSHLIWLHEVVLPRVLDAKGKDSMEYKNYTGIRDAVIWALYTIGAYEKLLRQVGHDKFLTEAYREKMLFYEQELMKYRTVEQLHMSESLEAYRSSLVTKALNMLDEKNKPK